MFLLLLFYILVPALTAGSLNVHELTALDEIQAIARGRLDYNETLYGELNDDDRTNIEHFINCYRREGYSAGGLLTSLQDIDPLLSGYSSKVLKDFVDLALQGNHLNFVFSALLEDPEYIDLALKSGDALVQGKHREFIEKATKAWLSKELAEFVKPMLEHTRTEVSVDISRHSVTDEICEKIRSGDLPVQEGFTFLHVHLNTHLSKLKRGKEKEEKHHALLGLLGMELSKKNPGELEELSFFESMVESLKDVFSPKISLKHKNVDAGRLIQVHNQLIDRLIEKRSIDSKDYSYGSEIDFFKSSFWPKINNLNDQIQQFISAQDATVSSPADNKKRKKIKKKLPLNEFPTGKVKVAKPKAEATGDSTIGSETMLPKAITDELAVAEPIATVVTLPPAVDAEEPIAEGDLVLPPEPELPVADIANANAALCAAAPPSLPMCTWNLLHKHQVNFSEMIKGFKDWFGASVANHRNNKTEISFCDANHRLIKIFCDNPHGSQSEKSWPAWRINMKKGLERAGCRWVLGGAA